MRKTWMFCALLMVFALLGSAVAADAQTTTHSAALNWGAVTVSGATYNVLRGTAPGATKTKIASGLTSASYFDANLPANTQFCYQVTTSVAGMSDSAPNTEVCGTTAQDGAPTPGPIIIIFK
jgi:hypothetical protein